MSTPSRCITRSRSTIPTPCAASSGWSTSATKSPTSTSSTTACRSSPATSRSGRGASARICSASAASAPTRRRAAPGLRSLAALDAVLESRGEEIAVGIERAGGVPRVVVALGGRMRAVLHVRRRCPHARPCEALADRLRLPVELANPLANLHVRDGALDAPVDRRSRTAADAPDRPRASSGRLTLEPDRRR